LADLPEVLPVKQRATAIGIASHVIRAEQCSVSGITDIAERPAAQRRGYQASVGRLRQHRVAVRARAPLRLGLAGGGTDLPDYAERFGGTVLNATIDRYAFASIQPRNDGMLFFDACDVSREERHQAARIVRGSRLPLHRGVYERMVRDYNNGEPLSITVTTVVDTPVGSGLGSSSALVVALIEAYGAYLDLAMSRYDVARLAHQIERMDLGLAGGRQDQYSAAFGGINFIEFLPGGRVVVNPLRFNEAVVNELESSLVVCFSGQSRLSDTIIREQSGHLRAHSLETLGAMHQLKQDASDMKAAIQLGDLEAFAAILQRSWLAKKRTAASVTTTQIEALEVLARRNGAMAAKVSGAGGGGFMMFVAPTERRFRLITALNAAGAQAYPVKLTERGSESWGIPSRR
jgi:D-glycero-alpha-D-manno-heptose-7-phosphate kinase